MGQLLRNTFKFSANCSKVLITTRKEVGAGHIKAVHLRHVEKLQLEDGWSWLMTKVAMHVMKVEAESLKDIALQIVGKCDGLPSCYQGHGRSPMQKRENKKCLGGVLLSPAWSSNTLLDEGEFCVIPEL